MTEKRYRDGSHRTVAPEETLRRIARLHGPMGITRIANVTGLDRIGIPVVMVVRPNSRALAVTQGKGPTLDAAKASGVMESVESWHAERVHRPLLLASRDELRFTHELIDVERLPRPSKSRWRDGLRTLWIEGDELLDGGRRWLPFEAVHTDFRLPPPAGSGAFYTSTSGLASGNHPLEATSHAICELVERDASALWFAGDDRARGARRVDLDSVDDPGCREMLRRYDDAGVAVAAWETTTDVELAAFDCMIVERRLDAVRPLPAAFGAGCHPARDVALMRALTEAAQSRLTSISGSRDDMDRRGHERAHAGDALRAIHELVTGSRGERRFDAAPTFDGSSFEEDVEHELDRLRAAGIGEVVAVDLARPELGIPVVKVVVPGLEPPHRIGGYLPGPRARAAAAGGARAS